jgi:hypothetical protein
VRSIHDMSLSSSRLVQAFRPAPNSARAMSRSRRIRGGGKAGAGEEVTPASSIFMRGGVMRIDIRDGASGMKDCEGRVTEHEEVGSDEGCPPVARKMYRE